MAGKTTAAATRHDLRGARGALGWAGSLTKDDCAMADTPETTKPKLTPANENPWYCLMTLHGEQPEGAWWDYDKELHAKNRRDWNRWAARALTEDQRNRLLEIRDVYGNPLFSRTELENPTESEWNTIEKKFISRIGYVGINITIPNPHHSVRFDSVEFYRALYFSGFIFPNACVFINTRFRRFSSFENAVFINYVNYQNSIFDSMVDFTNIKFFNYVDFPNSIFNSNANFSNSVFFQQANINSVCFSGEANFSGAKFSRNNFTSFSETKFDNTTDFLNAELEGETSFARAVFKTHPPSFHGAKLNEGTAFDGVAWPDPPSLPTNPIETDDAEKYKLSDWEWERARGALEYDIKNYQRLKQMMETLKKHEDELEFFAREMACKQVLHRANGETGKAWLLEMYGALSDYGRSVSRPTVWMIVVLAYSAVMMAAMMRWAPEPQLSLLPSLSEAFHLTYANLLSPLNIRKDFFDPEVLKKLPIWVQLISGFQTIAGVFFTFLIGLGLRNRFRMK